MHTITQTFDFDYGHRVLGHGGKCRFPHGHRGKAEVTVSAPDLDRLGMVMDFADLKREIGQWIEASWDHAFLVHPEDPLRTALENDLYGKRVYLMRLGNPTAELMAQELFQTAQGMLDGKADVLSVTVWETPSCCATFARELFGS